MKKIRAKKHLGQHFLIDEAIAEDISESLSSHGGYANVLEIGPGMGILTRFLVKSAKYSLAVIDIDQESITYLERYYPTLKGKIIHGDYLKIDTKTIFSNKYAIIGNFPYHISSQIFFKILEDKDNVLEVVGMLQKEVAERISSPPGNRTYGILSVLLQTYYDIEYLFTVQPDKFDPPPKVLSGVIRLKRNEVENLPCDEKLFKRIVKQGFQNRRKTLRNALKPLNLSDVIVARAIFDKRAEQLSVNDFIQLTQLIEQCSK